MTHYKSMYFRLFNEITKALEQIKEQNYGAATNILITAQQAAEEAYICCGEKSKEEDL